MINPDVLFKSINPQARQGFVTLYQAECEPPTNLSVEDKKDVVSRKISNKQKQYKRMKKQLENYDNEIREDYQELSELYESSDSD